MCLYTYARIFIGSFCAGNEFTILNDHFNKTVNQVNEGWTCGPRYNDSVN